MIASIITAGIAGTFLMTCFMYLMAFVADKRLKVIKVLATMLIKNTSNDKRLTNAPSAIYLAMIIHYVIGIFFAFIYYLLWKNGVGSATISWAMLFGFINGIMAAAGWRLFIALKKNSPVLPLRLYLLCIVAGHVLFAIGVLVVIQIMEGI